MSQDAVDAAAFRAVVHPTDLSPASDLAFAHALKVALAGRGRLDILHTEPSEPGDVDWSAFPAVRDTLGKWGLLEANSPTSAVAARLGLSVRKLDMIERDPVRGVEQYLERHPSDLIVLATHARDGVARLWRGSVAEPIARRARIATLFLPHGSSGFVDPETGQVSLRRILVPIDRDPDPGLVVERAWQLARAVGADQAALHLLHVGDKESAPPTPAPTDAAANVDVLVRRGPVVDTIVATAEELGVGLIAMATRGHDGFLDALRGSTTEQVLRRCERPLLAVPAS